MSGDERTWWRLGRGSCCRGPAFHLLGCPRVHIGWAGGGRGSSRLWKPCSWWRRSVPPRGRGTWCQRLWPRPRPILSLFLQGQEVPRGHLDGWQVCHHLEANGLHLGDQLCPPRAPVFFRPLLGDPQSAPGALCPPQRLPPGQGSAVCPGSIPAGTSLTPEWGQQQGSGGLPQFPIPHSHLQEGERLEGCRASDPTSH